MFTSKCHCTEKVLSGAKAATVPSRNNRNVELKTLGCLLYWITMTRHQIFSTPSLLFFNEYNTEPYILKFLYSRISVLPTFPQSTSHYLETITNTQNGTPASKSFLSICDFTFIVEKKDIPTELFSNRVFSQNLINRHCMRNYFGINASFSTSN